MNKVAIQTASNTERYAVLNRNDSETRTCLESVGPASEQTQLILTQSLSKVLSAGSVTNTNNATNSIEYLEKLGTIYQMGETMQLANNMFYRLCEARGNGDITTPEQYQLLLVNLIESTQKLIALSVSKDKTNSTAKDIIQAVPANQKLIDNLKILKTTSPIQNQN